MLQAGSGPILAQYGISSRLCLKKNDTYFI